VLGFLGLFGCFWLWLYLRYGGEVLDMSLYVPTAILLHTVLKFWVASEACRPLAQDRQSGALELMISTPLSVDEILEGQMLALKRQFGLAVILVLLADLVMFASATERNFFYGSNEWLMVFLVGVVLLISDMYTLAWVGMWLGLTTQKANRAARGAVLRVIVLPIVIFLGLMTLSLAGRARELLDLEGKLLESWFLVGMANDLFFFLWARNNLRRHFRTVVAERLYRKGWSPFAREEKSPAAAGAAEPVEVA
jgi:hypothetical protein